MAYRTEIQIGVKGVRELTQLQKKLDGTSRKIDELNKNQVKAFGGVAQSLNKYVSQLAQAEEALKKVAAGTKQEERAINNYVTALGNANGAKERQNRLIQEEISRRSRATVELQKYNAAAAAARPAGGSMSQRYLRPGAPIATTQYDQPIGPAPSPIHAFVGQSSPVEGRIKRIKEAQDSLMDATRQMEAVEQRMTQQELINDEKVFNAKLEDLVRLHAEELRQIKAVDKAELEAFDKKLKRREERKKTKTGTAGFLEKAGAFGLGAGFPLLFSGGVGQVAGGAIGTALAKSFGLAGEAAMGIQIALSAILGKVEELVTRFTEVGNAVNAIDMDALANTFITVNAEARTLVDSLVRAGESQAALAEAARQTALQTGVLPEATADITNNVNLLSNTWDEVVGSVSGLVSIIATPFVSALTAILQLVSKVVKGVNIWLSVTGMILKRTTEIILKIPLLQPILQFIERNTKGIVEQQEKGLAALIKTGTQLENQLRGNQQLFELEKKRTLGRTAAEKEINAEIDRAKALKTVDLELEKQIKDKREEFGDAVSHAAQVERDYQIILLEKAAELEKSKINQNHLLKQQQIELEKIKERYDDLNEDLKAREATLKGEIKIFSIQQKSLEGILDLERSRNELSSARLDLEESRLQRQLDQLNSVNGSHIIRGQIIDQIAQKQIQQARIEYQNNILSIDQSVTKAELARKQVDFEVKRIQLQVESLKLEAQSIKDLGLRQAALNRIYAQEQSTLNIAREMVAAADQQLATTREIAKNQKLAAGYALQGKIEAIEASAAEQKRAAFLERAAAASKQVATSTAVANAAGGAAGAGGAGATGGIGGGSRTTGTVTTSIPIDPEVEERVQSRSGRGFRSVEEMVGALEEEQRKVNRMEVAMARYSPGTGTSSGGASRVNPVVNVTTGPVMNMDGQNYVNQNDFVAGLQSASTRGAEMAMQMITSSGGARRRLGVG